MNKKILTTAITLSAVLALTACGGGQEADKTTNNAAKNNKAVETTTKEENKTTEVVTEDTTKDAGAITTAAAGELSEAKVTKEEAFDKFLELHAGAKIGAFSLGYDDGVLQYSIEGYDDANEYEVEINAVDGNVIKDETDKKDDKNVGDIQKDALAKLDGFVEEALKDAESDYKADGVGLDYENGKLIAEVEVTNGSKDIDYDYDFETGKLLQKDM